MLEVGYYYLKSSFTIKYMQVEILSIFPKHHQIVSQDCFAFILQW